MIETRGWQESGLQKFIDHKHQSFLLEACPGAGKTMFSGMCASALLERRLVDFCLVVVPTTALKGDKSAGFLGDWHKVGIEITTVLKDGKGRPTEFCGGAVTYQQLVNFVPTIETWARTGVRLFVTFDEVHHASEYNLWGAAAERVARCSTKILAMTGTPFRGDGRRISFVNYNADGIAISDHSYSYRQSVAERVCRPVQFITDDGVAEFIRNEEDHEVRVSEANEENQSDVASTIFGKDSRWLRTVIEKADAALDNYRSWDVDAGGLVICRPGTDETAETDNRHLMQIAKLVGEVTGEDPEVVTHDDPKANDKIERFRGGHARWICAVRKISEGVDIKRLRVAVMANRPTTELLFRQIVGRVVRVDNERRPGDATVYIAKFPQLNEWASRLADDAEAGLREQKPQKERNQGDLDATSSSFVPIGSSHEDGGAISDFGEAFSAAEINAAERLKRGDQQLYDLPVTKIAYLSRVLGVKPDPIEPATQPLHVQKKELRLEINKKVKQLAYVLNNEKPDFSAVWVSLHRHTGAKNIDDLTDNHSLDVMRQALRLLQNMLVGKDDAAA